VRLEVCEAAGGSGCDGETLSIPGVRDVSLSLAAAGTAAAIEIVTVIDDIVAAMVRQRRDGLIRAVRRRGSERQTRLTY